MPHEGPLRVKLRYSAFMRVIGIDPAPAKGGTVFDGEDRHLSLLDLGEYLSSISTQDSEKYQVFNAPIVASPDGSAIVIGHTASPTVLGQVYPEIIDYRQDPADSRETGRTPPSAMLRRHQNR